MKYLRTVKLIEIESGIVVTRGWGEWVVRDSYIMDVSVQILCGKTDNSTLYRLLNKLESSLF